MILSTCKGDGHGHDDDGEDGGDDGDNDGRGYILVMTTVVPMKMADEDDADSGEMWCRYCHGDDIGVGVLLLLMMMIKMQTAMKELVSAVCFTVSGITSVRATQPSSIS